MGKLILEVPLISQLPELPTGCEITAVAMMLRYKGCNVDKVILANEMPRDSEDPIKGYVGDPFTPDGWTIYPSALVKLVEYYAGTAFDLTGVNVSFLEKQLDNEKPVVVWVSSMHGFTVHALTITGYDHDNFYYNDPWTAERDVKVSKTEFHTMWKGQHQRAISY